MVDKSDRGNQNTRKQQTNPGDHKAVRGILNIAHAFFNRYVAEADQKKTDAESDRKWIRRGSIAAIIYTAITSAIMVISIIQARISRNTEITQLRAYMGVKEVAVVCCDTINYEGPPIEISNVIRVIVRNGGQTPASEVRVRIGQYELPFTMIYPPSLNYNDPVSVRAPAATPMTEGSIHILPGETGRFSVPAASVAVLRAKARMSRIIIYGHIEATDVFGIRRFTDFCKIYSYAYRAGEDFTDCPEHNNERP